MVRRLLCSEYQPRLLHRRKFCGNPFRGTVAMKYEMQVRHGLRLVLHGREDFVGVGISQSVGENISDGTFAIIPERCCCFDVLRLNLFGSV